MRTLSVSSIYLVFRNNAVSSTPVAFILLDPQDLQLQPFFHETRHSCLPSLSCSTVLPCFELRCCCQERGHDIFTIAIEMLIGLVRVLPYVPPEQLYIFSFVLYYLAEIFPLDILCECEYFLLDVPVLNFKSLDVATKKYYISRLHLT